MHTHVGEMPRGTSDGSPTVQGIPSAVPSSPPQNRPDPVRPEGRRTGRSGSPSHPISTSAGQGGQCDIPLPRRTTLVGSLKVHRLVLGFLLPICQPHERRTLTTLGVTAAVSGTRMKMKLLCMA